MLLSVIVATSILLIVSFITLNFVHAVQIEPYMDEIFHIRQAKVFCAKNFSHWDPMITTLPGLYLSSLFMLFPFSLIVGLGDFTTVCTTYNLRAGNLVYCCGNLLLMFLLSKLLFLKTQNRRGATCHLLLNAFTLSLFPVLYFFTWLYYTDPGSVFFTLLMYYLCLRGNHGFASISGIISILFRQTNVVWVLFCFAMSASEVLAGKQKEKKKMRQKLPSMTDWEVMKSLLNIIFSSGAKNFLLIVKDIFVDGIPYLLVMVSFIFFVYLNNGIVLGDRSNHQASFNFPQVFYFLVVSTAFAFIHMIHPRLIFTCVKTVLKNPVQVILFAALSFFLIKHYTYEHKYTLSDNRHYTFYMWSKLYKRFTWARYTMIPVYLFSLLNFYYLTLHKGLLWRLSTCICITLCLVPQALLEFRYYIIPFYIIRLNMQLPSVKALLVELIFYVAINVFTVYMFTQKPFSWPNDPSPQRFMW